MKKGIPYSTTYLVFPHRDGSVNSTKQLSSTYKKLKNITFLLISEN